MKLYVKKELVDFGGNGIPMGEGENSPKARLSDVFIDSLVRRQIQGDAALTIEAKERMWNLARRIQKVTDDETNEHGMVEMPIEDLSFLRKRIGQTHTVAVVGPAIEAMNWIPAHTELKAL